MKKYEIIIKSMHKIGSKTAMETTVSLTDFSKMIDELCEEYGKTRAEVLDDIENAE